MITVKDYKADFPLLMQDPTIYIDLSLIHISEPTRPY